MNALLLIVAAAQVLLIVALGFMMRRETRAVRAHTEELRRHAQEMAALVDRLQRDDESIAKAVIAIGEKP